LRSVEPNRNTELAHHTCRFGAANDDAGFAQSRYEVLPGYGCSGGIDERARAHTCHEDHDVEIAGQYPMGKPEYVLIRSLGNLPGRRRDHGDAAMVGDQLRYLLGTTTLERKHAQAIES